MSVRYRNILLAATGGVLLCSMGCATAPGTPLAAGSRATVDGTVVSIDTKPWTYDGSAVVLLDTAARGRVAVHLPARWNLCKAPAIEMSTLAAGKRARATGTVDSEGALVVCSNVEDRLVAID